MISLLFIGMIVFAFNVRPIKADTQTVYINADGSITPAGAPIVTSDKITYTLTGNISYPTYCGIVVQRSSIVIDGEGYTVQGNQSGIGFNLTSIISDTIKNTDIMDFTYGIQLVSSLNNSISGNVITNNYDSIWLEDSSDHNNVSNNVMAHNRGGGTGIYCDFSSNINSMNENAIRYIDSGIYLEGSSSDSVGENNITSSGFSILLDGSLNDSINGNRITSASDYGVWLLGSLYSSIDDNAITNSYYGMWLDSSSSNSIRGNTFADDGLYVSSSYENLVENNTVNGKPLIYLEDVTNYNVSDAGQVILVRCNSITVENLDLSSASVGIELWETNGSAIYGNNITANNYYGIWLYSSSNDSISENDVVYGYYGIWLEFSSYNNIIGNNITWSYFDFEIVSSSGNEIYHNNIHNTVAPGEVSDFGASTNSWDAGYPNGGNYWSTYVGDDLYSGPYQNVTGSDGIGDTPYIIDGNNTDHYPLMQPWVGSTPTSTYINLSVSLVPAGSIVTCTVTVSGANAGPRATGTVTWSTSSGTGNFSTPVGTLSSGSCSTMYIDSSPGSVDIAAYYSGDSNNQPSSGSTTLTVVSSGSIYYSQNYSSVQAAINASKAGSTLIVAPGIYRENLILDKKLTIIGDPDQAQFGGGGSGIFLTVYSGANGSIVTGFEITSYTDGILVYASNCQIYSNTMNSMVESGIVLDGSNATGDVVHDNAFENTSTPINLTASAGGNTIYGNIISSQATVTISVGTNDNTVYQNAISGSSIVLNVTNSQGNTFYHDDFLATTEIVATGTNTWDNGYPAGGNYWSDYQAKYPNAAEIDSSGIWNTSYVINGNNQDNYPLMKPYAPSVGHETAVTLVVSTKTVIMQGYTGSVTVTAFNRGQYTETFSVTAYGNSTAIGTQQITNLGSAGQITLTFTWNTTGYAKGKYTINAYAEPVQGETDIANNNFTDGPIYVSMVGDLTGATPFVPDGKCDGRDITVVAKCFGSGIGDPRYNPNCDILNRGKIDGRDITIVAKHFGQHDP